MSFCQLDLVQVGDIMAMVSSGTPTSSSSSRTGSYRKSTTWWPQIALFHKRTRAAVAGGGGGTGGGGGGGGGGKGELCLGRMNNWHETSVLSLWCIHVCCACRS